MIQGNNTTLWPMENTQLWSLNRNRTKKKRKKVKGVQIFLFVQRYTSTYHELLMCNLVSMVALTYPLRVEQVFSAPQSPKMIGRPKLEETVRNGKTSKFRYFILISIQIMNVYECNGTNIFMRWKMTCSIQRGEAELNGTFHLSPNENICSIARMRKHSLFVLYNLYKDSNSSTNLTENALKNYFSSSKTFFKPRVQLYAGSITRTLASG